ncbi:hypothetical protein F5Y18DRAFT_393280 [Xylariaceae sp. FL1019]|nr:hypothetical protein F5Y18DRAFT_393280 [Xylariaceae sp. FL1019]
MLKSQRDRMGPSRNDPETQRAYLNGISETFQSLVRDALGASYAHHEMFSKHELRLVTRVVEAKDEYSEKMAKHGHMRHFQTTEGEGGHLNEISRLTLKEADKFEIDHSLYPELEEILEPFTTEMPEADENTDILDYIEHVYTSSRGQEIGTFVGTLLGTMFQEQSKKWDTITLVHMTRVIYHVHHFIHEALKGSCPDLRVYHELWDAYLLDELQSSYRAALECAKLLLEIERHCCPITLNHYFNDNLQKAQGERLVRAMEELGISEARSPAAESPDATIDDVVRIKKSDLQNMVVDKANSTHVREYMHDVLHSYYKVSRKRFVDVVCQQAVNYYLLAGDQSPLKIFQTQMVLRLTEEQLDMIAGEDSHVRQRREKLSRDIGNFEAALKVLKGSG